MKEDYEAEVVDDKYLNREDGGAESDASVHSTESDDDSTKKVTDYEYDREFVPYKKKKILCEVSQAVKAKLRRRDRDDSSSIDTVTISDDEEEG